MPPLSPTLPAPEWDDEYADAWFYRWVKGFLQEDPPPELRPCQDDPELRDAVAEALLARRAELTRWVDDKTFVPDCHNGHWEIDWKAVIGTAWDLIPECRARLEAEKFPNLDDWLAALHRGELGYGLHDGPWEPHAGKFLEGATRETFYEATRQRELRRPRACRGCGREFRLVDYREGGPQQRRCNATRCPDCRSGTQRRTARKEGRR